MAGSVRPESAAAGQHDVDEVILPLKQWGVVSDEESLLLFTVKLCGYYLSKKIVKLRQRKPQCGSKKKKQLV